MAITLEDIGSKPIRPDSCRYFLLKCTVADDARVPVDKKTGEIRDTMYLNVYWNGGSDSLRCDPADTEMSSLKKGDNVDVICDVASFGGNLYMGKAQLLANHGNPAATRAGKQTK